MENPDIISNITPAWKSLLQKQARVYGMCRDNRAYLNACESKSDAIKLYKQTIDWALESGYPGLDTIRKHFGNCADDGLFVDRVFNGEELTDLQVYVFHHCSGTIRVGLNLRKKIIPMLYFADDCDMTVLGLDDLKYFPDRVPIYTFGQNKIVAQNTPNTEFKHYHHERTI